MTKHLEKNTDEKKLSFFDQKLQLTKTTERNGNLT